jgi:hypothetical protein
MPPLELRYESKQTYNYYTQNIVLTGQTNFDIYADNKLVSYQKCTQIRLANME